MHQTYLEATIDPQRPRALPSSPPFESPCFAKILKNFVIFKYEGRYAEAKKRAIDKIHYTLMSCANKLLLPKIGERSTKILDDSSYEVFYPLWEQYCLPGLREDKNKVVEKGRGPIQTCNAFGRHFFRAFLPILKTTMLSQYQLTREMENIAPTFFHDLTEELWDSHSIVCMDGFDEAMTHSHCIQEQLNVEAAEKEESSSYRPSFMPLKRKSDALREIGPLAEAHYAKYRAGELDPSAEPAIPVPMPVKQTPKPDLMVTDESSEDPLNDNPIEARDKQAKMEELQGVLTSVVINNDDTPEMMILLITIRNVFVEMLPNMPKEYITRLVLDKNHRSLLLIKHNVVVGGVCFRPWKQGFIEIAFLAIKGVHQVKGYGTHLMNHLKSKMQEEKYLFFVTYADNFAIPYFKKQGFSEFVTMDRDWWAGYIKDYEDSTLMECHIHPTFEYPKVPEIIRKQRAVCSP